MYKLYINIYIYILTVLYDCLSMDVVSHASAYCVAADWTRLGRSLNVHISSVLLSVPNIHMAESVESTWEAAQQQIIWRKKLNEVLDKTRFGLPQHSNSLTVSIDTSHQDFRKKSKSLSGFCPIRDIKCESTAVSVSVESFGLSWSGSVCSCLILLSRHPHYILTFHKCNNFSKCKTDSLH